MSFYLGYAILTIKCSFPQPFTSPRPPSFQFTPAVCLFSSYVSLDSDKSTQPKGLPRLPILSANFENANKRKRSEDVEESSGLRGGSMAATSMAVQISANRARRADNRTIVESHIKRREMADTAAVIADMRNGMGAVEFCPPCWLTGENPKHSSFSCSLTAEGWLDRAAMSGYRSFRGHLNVSSGHCFKCCLPQVNCLLVELSPAQLLTLCSLFDF